MDDFDLKRIVKAVEEDLRVKPIEKPKVVVQNHSKDEPEGHVVNLDELTCTCEDYEYNCQSEEKEVGDNKYCKHLFRVIFEKHSMI